MGLHCCRSKSAAVELSSIATITTDFAMQVQWSSAFHRSALFVDYFHVFLFRTCCFKWASACSVSMAWRSRHFVSSFYAAMPAQRTHRRMFFTAFFSLSAALNFRSFSCRTTREMNRQFCPSCGNHTLIKVSLSPPSWPCAFFVADSL